MKKRKKYISKARLDRIAKEIFSKKKDLVFLYDSQQLCNEYKVEYRVLFSKLKKNYQFNYTQYRRWRIRKYILENQYNMSVQEICDIIKVSKVTYYKYATRKYLTGGDRRSKDWRLTERIYFKNEG